MRAAPGNYSESLETRPLSTGSSRRSGCGRRRAPDLPSGPWPPAVSGSGSFYRCPTVPTPWPRGSARRSPAPRTLTATVTASAGRERRQGPLAAIRLAVALVAAVTMLVVGLAGLFASAASAQTLRQPETRVAASTTAGGQMVGAHELVLAGQRRARAPSYDPMAVGSCVAAETEPEFTGARGPASGRPFDPEAAGGPVQSLSTSGVDVNSEGVQSVAEHLQRFVPEGGQLEAPEQGMLDRLSAIASGELEPTQPDLNFYTHELDEAGRYEALGYGGTSYLGGPEMYDVWNNAHTAALEDYGVSDAELFAEGLLP